MDPDPKDAGPLHVAASEALALAATARQYADHGRADEARKLLEGLLVLEPALAYLHTALACVYLRLAREDEALFEFEAALALDPKDAAAHTYAGEIRLRKGEAAVGLRHLEAAVALDPDGHDPYANRARTLRAAAAAATPR